MYFVLEFDEERQKLAATEREESRQLRETVNTLREQLELTKSKEQENIQKAMASAAGENRQLKVNLQKLREELDRAVSIKTKLCKRPLYLRKMKFVNFERHLKPFENN